MVSTNLTDPQWAGTRVLTGDIAAAVCDLKAQQDGELLGSSTRLESRGIHELKGVPDAWEIYAVVG